MCIKETFSDFFYYSDGKLFWKVNRKRIKAGTEAGTIHSNGRKQVILNGKQYRVHRVIFAIYYGYLPSEIDHIDGNPLNNKIENLREATRSLNMKNTKIRKNNTSGIKGVYWNKILKKWSVQLNINGKVKGFGSYFDKEIARFIIQTMRNKYHKEFANHG